MNTTRITTIQIVAFSLRVIGVCLEKRADQNCN